MLTKLITGLLTATGMIWLLSSVAGSLVDWIVQLAAVPADWTGLMTLAAWVLVLFFGGGFGIGVTAIVTMLALLIVDTVSS
jgi:hypothetical protein